MALLFIFVLVFYSASFMCTLPILFSGSLLFVFLVFCGSGLSLYLLMLASVLMTELRWTVTTGRSIRCGTSIFRDVAQCNVAVNLIFQLRTAAF